VTGLIDLKIIKEELVFKKDGIGRRKLADENFTKTIILCPYLFLFLVSRELFLCVLIFAVPLYAWKTHV
jgi:hypothetical protein